MQGFPRSWIERIIAIDSVTDRSNDPMIQFLIPLLQEAGLYVDLHRVREGTIDFFNLIARPVEQTQAPVLVLHTHLDTVTPGDPALWTESGGQPFRATIKGDKIYGLGSADVKLDFLCKLWAARTQKSKLPFALVGSYGEERGLVGAKKLLQARKVAPRYALIGEPSDLELIYAHKGHLIATVELPLDTGPAIETGVWEGRAAHSSTPSLGHNALAEALRWIGVQRRGLTRLEGGTDSNRVPEQCQAHLTARMGPATKNLVEWFAKLETWEQSLHGQRDRRFSPANITLSLNLARTIRDKVQITFDMRLLPSTDPKTVEAKLSAIVSKHGKLLDLSIDPPLDGNPKSKFLKVTSSALKRCGVTPKIRTKASSTEAALYYQQGAEAIVFGPGVSIGNVHRPNEHNLVSHLDIATRFYSEVLARASAQEL